MMAGLLSDPTVPQAKKRKRRTHTLPSNNSSNATHKDEYATSDVESQDLKNLENYILYSRKHYNDITKLIERTQAAQGNYSKYCLLAVSLCRIFSHLLVSGKMKKPKEQARDENMIIDWIVAKFHEYRELLLNSLRSGKTEEQKVSLELLVHLTKEEAAIQGSDLSHSGRKGTFSLTLNALVIAHPGTEIRTSFAEKYVNKYGDIRLFTFRELSQICNESKGTEAIESLIGIMAATNAVQGSEQDIKELYLGSLPKSKFDAYSLMAQRIAAQQVWMSILTSDLVKAQRKTLLALMSDRIVPSFVRPELLMDFLTNSFDVGGSIALMALAGLFHLIQKKNLDYPQFYVKLYSLLDHNILHSKHRSRFFRLLDTFLGSTHLPAALVASFIKRLARLCLHAPPAGIVVVVPWIYNQFKRHPTCTFMIQRRPYEANMTTTSITTELEDSFRMDETNPMVTGAIDSSLWEIETMQSHYHPYVATLAKIISEQFTKQSYSMEDFLDYSYTSILDAELSKPMRRAPVIEYEIPKRIFTASHENASQDDNLLLRLWNFDTQAAHTSPLVGP